MISEPNLDTVQDDAGFKLSSTSCAICHDFCWLLRPNDTAEKWYMKSEEFVLSDVRDCASCSVISKAIDFCKDEWGQYGEWASVGGENKTIEINHSTGENTYSTIKLDFCQGSEEENLRVFKDSSSKDAIDWISKYSKGCIENHELCAGLSGGLPTRVIDVGTSESQMTLKLYESCGEIEDYVTLSHCWGNIQTIKTTQLNFKDHLRGIEWSALSPTFKDAITLTRRLKYRYIWIDSLCIIQGDENDWQRESGKMANIYESSILTIAATRASDGTQGIFSTRNHGFETDLTPRRPLPGTAVVDEYEGENNTPTQIYIYRQIQHQELAADSDGDPLSRRAWAFQERLLSRRIVHFTSQELVYECVSMQRCECKTRDKGYNIQNDWGDGVKHFFYKARTDGLSSNDWSRILQIYSGGNTTFERDKLPAFSGVASRMQSDLSGKYLGGIFENNLIDGLAWSVRSVGERPAQYIAPSWSWASVKTGVKFDGNSWVSDAEILDADCTSTKLNPFGCVSAGHLTIRGKTIQATVKKNEELDRDPRSLDYVLVRDGNKMAFDQDVWINNIPPEGLPVICLQVATEIVPEAKAFRDEPPKKLVLVLKDKENSSGQFERIGRMKLEMGFAAEIKSFIAPMWHFFFEGLSGPDVPGRTFEKWFEDAKLDTVTIL